jgi:hypothetical protein
LKEQQEALQQKKAQLIKENIKAQRKVDQFDKLLDDFVEVIILDNKIASLLIPSYSLRDLL